MALIDDLRAAAATEAASLGASFVGTEHLFLAWLTTATGPLADAVTGSGLTVTAFREILAHAKSSGRALPPGGEGGVSTRAAKVLQLTAERAAAAGREQPTLDDVLLALIQEPHGAIARALSAHSLKPSRLKSLGREVGDPSPKRASPTPRPQAATEERTADRPRAAPAQQATSRPPRRDVEVDDIPEPRRPERPRLTPKKVAPLRPPTPKRRWSPWLLLYLAIPASIVLARGDAAPTLVFAVACLSVLPLAALMGTATEHLAERSGPALGGLMNATFGNAAELIIAIVALRAGLVDLVKASITGSILGNLLLVLGIALVAGGLRRPLLTFNRTAAGMATAMLALAVAGLVMPAIFHSVHPGNDLFERELSDVVAVILAATYVLSLVFVLRTHRPLFMREGPPRHAAATPTWSVAKSLIFLAVATVGVAVESEILVGVIEPTTRALGVSEVFLGLILIPIIGNAAEHSTAVVAAFKGDADLGLQIAVGSSTQVALFVAPLLILLAPLLTTSPMTLVFTPFEVAGLGLAVVVSGFITLDGESNWFEGAQLVALYAIFGTVAWFI